MRGYLVHYNIFLISFIFLCTTAAASITDVKFKNKCVTAFTLPVSNQSKVVFGSLIRPKSIKDFIGDFFEKNPFVLRRNRPDFNAPLISLDDVAVILNHGDLTYGQDWKLVRNTMRDGKWWTGMLPAQEGEPAAFAQRALREGFSLIINAVQKYSSRLSYISSAITEVLGYHVNINLYMSPAGSQGFEVHFDWMDGLVLQVMFNMCFLFQLQSWFDFYILFYLKIIGKKSWSVYDPIVFSFPRADSVFHLHRDELLDASTGPKDKQIFPLSAGIEVILPIEFISTV